MERARASRARLPKKNAVQSDRLLKRKQVALYWAARMRIEFADPGYGQASKLTYEEFREFSRSLADLLDPPKAT